MSFAGDRRGLASPTVRRVVAAVLAGEGVAAAAVSVTFLSGSRMRTLNRQSLGRDRATDVIAFPLSQPDTVVGDVYVCPAAARGTARRLRRSVREELVRLVVHGTLHVLGYDHPEGPDRERSPMWDRQEHYVHQILASARAS